MRINLGYAAIDDVTCLYVGRIGDVIVATPFLRALRKRFPKSRLRIVVGHRAASVLPLLSFVDEGVALEKPARLIENLKLAASLLARKCDLLVDLNSSFSKTSTMMARAVRAPLKLAFDKGRGPAVFNRTLPPPGEREHMSQRYARLAEAIGAPFSPELELKVPPAAQEQADAILAPLLKGRDADFKILVHPGNITRQPSFWPAERLRELCARLKAEKGVALYFLAGPGELETVESIAAGGTILPAASFSVVAGMVKRMDMLMGSLTSTTHLAAAVGTATFAFYEGYTHTVWQPRGARHGGTVSAEWNECRSTTVEEAFSGVRDHMSRLRPVKR
jgi:ADP-heptose:LPS heptosyltransferase